MSDDHVGLLEAPPEQERVIGDYRGEERGPTMIVLGGIHGNEPSGIRSSQRVFERLERDRLPIRGRLVALVGNRLALRNSERFVEKDLNRQWTEANVRRLLDAERVTAPEDREQRAVLGALSELTRTAHEVVFLDMHTSSADGPPFVTIGDTLRNRAFAMKFPVPVILGLEEQVDGAMLEYMNNIGHVTVGVEAGRHDRESSVDHHEAVLWLALIAAKMLRREDLPDVERFEAVLRRATVGTPRIVEVRYRHKVQAGDGFRMEPGFVNFQRISQGQLLARDSRGELRAPEDGRVLLPLYQGQGDDGFFVARDVRPFWLRVSALLRRLRLDGLIRLLPGISVHRAEPGSLIVNLRVARFYPLEIFHLLGYRKRRMHGPVMMVSRRRYDLSPPRTT